MSDREKSTHRIGEVALGALKQIGLSASPQNYELWYAHVEGRAPSLSRDIQKSLDPEGKLDQEAADALYKKHIQHGDLTRSVIDLVAKFQTEVTDLYDVIDKTGEATNGHSETLSGLSDQLRQSTEEFPAVGALLEGVMSVAKEMRAQNGQLEMRLAESTTEINALQRNLESIEAEALKDSLTGVGNRTAVDRFLEEQMASAVAQDKELALILSDVDHFKKFNDTWGHTTGDQVLRLVAEVMNANVKGQDFLARYGGEEFIIALPGTSVKNAKMLADRIRTAIQSRRLKKRRTNEDLGVITVSMGVAGHEKLDTLESFIERADACMYAAKNAGRNRVFCEEDMQAGERAPDADENEAGVA